MRRRDLVANVVSTPWGVFNTQPVVGYTPDRALSGTGTALATFNLRVSRTFGFGKKLERASNTGGDFGGPRGGGGGSRGGTGGFRGLSGGGGPGARNGRRPQQSALQPYVQCVCAKLIQSRESRNTGRQPGLATLWSGKRTCRRPIFFAERGAPLRSAGVVLVLNSDRSIGRPSLSNPRAKGWGHGEETRYARC